MCVCVCEESLKKMIENFIKSIIKNRRLTFRLL